MKFIKAFIAVAALLLPLSALAQNIYIYPGPDEDWNYLYDYGDVEVGSSSVMIFQIGNEEGALSSLLLNKLQPQNARRVIKGVSCAKYRRMGIKRIISN